MEINWNLIFVIAISVHAIGHILGFIHTFELIKLTGMPTNESWLLTKQFKLDKTIIQVVSLLWLVVIIGFLIVAGAFWFELSWWKSLAVPMIILSVTLFITWFNSFPVNTHIGATIGNIVIVIGMLHFS
ncbi:MAG: hypothetical protein ACW98F_11490 [Candidatus Hodarchaeales archaeon]|jgi:hypothetical protein